MGTQGGDSVWISRRSQFGYDVTLTYSDDCLRQGIGEDDANTRLCNRDCTDGRRCSDSMGRDEPDAGMDPAWTKAAPYCIPQSTARGGVRTVSPGGGAVPGCVPEGARAVSFR